MRIFLLLGSSRRLDARLHTRSSKDGQRLAGVALPIRDVTRAARREVVDIVPSIRRPILRALFRLTTSGS
jgi:hypothetical protein